MESKTEQINSIEIQVQQIVEQAFTIMTSDPDQCIELGRTALLIAKKHNYNIGIGLAYRHIGLGYSHHGDYFSALKNFKQAELLFEKEQYFPGLRSIYNNIGCVYNEWNDLGKALQYYQKSLELETKSSNPDTTCSILNNIGRVYSDLKDNKKSLQYYKEVLNICEEYNLGYIQSIALNNIGHVYYALKETDNAEKYLLMAISANEAINNIHGLSHAYICLSRLKADAGLFEEAISLLNKALSNAQELEDKYTISIIFFHYARLYEKMDKIDEQQEYLEKCVAVSEPNHYRAKTLSACIMLSKLYEKKSDFQACLHCYKKIQEIKDFINDEKRTKTIHEILTKMEVEKTEKEKEILRLKNIELEKQNQLIVIRNTFGKLLNDEGHAHKDQIVFKSEKMNEVLVLMAQVAAAENTDVLITGESGTGKELVARGIHHFSSRKQQIFFDVNCTAVPDNLFESEFFGHTKNAFTGAVSSKKGGFEIANKGTLFLDEIGDMPMSLQTKLLRVLEERKIRRVGSTEDIHLDIRIIASTNQNLQKKVELNLFRTDLYYRLNKFNIHIPPLRERPEDIIPLVNYYLEKFCLSMRKPLKPLSSQTVELLKKYQFPGNVRELRNIVEKAVIMSRVYDKFLIISDTHQHNDKSIGGFAPAEMADLSLEQFERLEKEAIIEAMKRAFNNQTKAAKLLNITRSGLQRRIIKFGLEFPL